MKKQNILFSSACILGIILCVSFGVGFFYILNYEEKPTYTVYYCLNSTYSYDDVYMKKLIIISLILRI